MDREIGDRAVTATTTQGVQQADFDTDLAKGLTEDVVRERREQYGPNALEEKKVSALHRVLVGFWGPIPWMIEAAAILSVVVGSWADFSIILTMLLVNVGVKFWQENKANNEIELLKARLAPKARVLRGGEWQTMPAEELVPGDVVNLRLGNIVPADVKLVKGDGLSVDESALTGESLPVDKAVGDVAYSGSVAKLGDMTAIVTATGMATYFGKTAQLVAGAGTRSHFQRAVLKVGNFLLFATLALTALIIIVAIFRHSPFLETLQFALILTVAAIPVALPAVLSVTMAVGAERLARMKAIVTRLVSIEELAGVDLLCADKTGTLTKNELTLADPAPSKGVDRDDLLLGAALASDRDNPDSIDGAVLAAAGAVLKAAKCEVSRFVPFDPVHKRTEAEATTGGRAFTVTKGAPQVILDIVRLAPEGRQAVENQVDAFAEDGYRTIAVARRDDGRIWRLLGLLPILDPPRDNSAETIRRVKAMGVSVKMITGDHEAIARQIAGQVGLEKSILGADEALAGSEGEIAARIEKAAGVARVFPEHKYKIVCALQKADHIVAMTGDGVNDAPALSQADAGIAVSGATDAARAAADLVLTASGLSVIAAAMEEARKIFERMRGYATFRIAETIQVLLFMTLSILVFNFYPVTAIMIVLLAVLNDFPIMMIAYDNAAVVEKPLRWDMQRVLTVAACLGVSGVVASFLLFWYADVVLKLPRDMLQTVIFLKLLVAGHLTIYVTRHRSWFWTRPFPSWKLFVTIEATQVVGTLIAVYGVFVTPIGWTYALAVWAYALAWLPLTNLIAMSVRRLFDFEARHQTAHLARTERPFNSGMRRR